MTTTIICSETPCAVGCSHITMSNEHSKSLKTTNQYSVIFSYMLDTTTKWPKKLVMWWKWSNYVLMSLHYLSVSLQLQSSSLSTVLISIQNLACCYSFYAPVYPQFQCQCGNMPAVTIQRSILSTVPIAIQQFASYSSFNAVAYLLFQIPLKRSRDSLSLFCVGSSRRTML
jgi:hypothetical protein